MFEWIENIRKHSKVLIFDCLWLTVVFLNWISSVMRQKAESQNECFKKTKHAKFSEKRIFRFSENLACFVFFKHPFWDAPFCPITDILSFELVSWLFLWYLGENGQMPQYYIILLYVIYHILFPWFFWLTMRFWPVVEIGQLLTCLSFSA